MFLLGRPNFQVLSLLLSGSVSLKKCLKKPTTTHPIQCLPPKSASHNSPCHPYITHLNPPPLKPPEKRPTLPTLPRVFFRHRQPPTDTQRRGVAVGLESSPLRQVPNRSTPGEPIHPTTPDRCVTSESPPRETWKLALAYWWVVGGWCLGGWGW